MYLYLNPDYGEWSIHTILGTNGWFWRATATDSDPTPLKIAGYWTSQASSGPEVAVAAVCVSSWEPTSEPTTTFGPTPEPLTAKSDDELKSAVAAVAAGGTVALERESISLAMYVQYDEEGLDWHSGLYVPSFLQDITIKGLPSTRTRLVGDGTFKLLHLGAGTTLTLEDLVFENGYDAEYAGAVFLYRYSTCKGDSKPSSGGSSSVTVTSGPPPLPHLPPAYRCRWVNNHAEGRGGAIGILLASLFLWDCEFAANSAAFGGAIGAFVESRVVAYDTSFSDGHASTVGGAANVGDSSEGDFFNCNFFNNTASDGGALAATLGSEVRVNGGKLQGNTAAGEGGAVSVTSGSTVEIQDAVVKDNRAASGGGINCRDASVHLARVKATENAAVGTGAEGIGGFLRLQGTEAAGSLSNSTVDSCTASTQGGGVAASDDAAALTIDGTAFYDCAAGAFGGAASIEGLTVTSITQSSFEGSQVHYVPEDTCLTLSLEDVGGNGWWGALLRIYREPDYVGEEIYGCDVSCNGGYSCDELDYLWSYDTVESNDDGTCTYANLDLGTTYACDCSGCRCNEEWPPRNSHALYTSTGPPDGSSLATDQVCLGTAFGDSRYVMVISADGFPREVAVSMPPYVLSATAHEVHRFDAGGIATLDGCRTVRR